ncbi:MAG TPA: hypothetical protein VLG74_08975 [Blastocatellia bacterium]|nr:hypothetical protein [Blastocatellia bacterium]
MASITYDEAAHLLRRMGFGGSPAEIDEIASLSTSGSSGECPAFVDWQDMRLSFASGS